MADIWMGYTTMKKAIRDKRLELRGPKGLKSGIDDWFSYSLFADPEAMKQDLA